MKKLNWTSNVFLNSFKIYEQKEQIGYLKKVLFKKIFQAEIFGKQYTFISKGFYKQTTEIYDSNNMLIGSVIHNGFIANSKIEINENITFWKYVSSFRTKWEICEDYTDEVLLKYNGFLKSGSIESGTNDGLLILIGLFNHYKSNRFSNYSIALLAVMVIIKLIDKLV